MFSIQVRETGMKLWHTFMARNRLRVAAASLYDGYDVSRRLMVVDASLNHSIACLATGAFLTGYLMMLGVSSAVINVIIQLPQLIAVVQLAAPLFYEKREGRLRYIRILYPAFRFLLCAAFLIAPLLPSTGWRVFLFCLLYLGGFVFGFLCDPCYMDYLTRVTPVSMRGRFTAKRDMVFVTVGTGMSLIGSWVLDRFRARDAEFAGFMTVYAVLLFFAILLFFCYRGMTEVPPRVSRSPKSKLRLRDVLYLPFQNKTYRKFMTINAAYTAAVFFSSAFVNLYLLPVTGFNYTYIAAMNMLGTVVRIFFMRRWIVLAEKRSMKHVMGIGCVLSLINIGCIAFATAENWPVLLPMLYAVGGVSGSATGIALLNLNTTSAPEENRTAYFSVNAAVTPLSGFVASQIGNLIGATVLKPVTVFVFGTAMGYMQLLILVSGVALLGLGVFVFLDVRKKNDLSDVQVVREDA